MQTTVKKIGRAGPGSILAWYWSPAPDDAGNFAVANTGEVYRVGDSLSVRGDVILCARGLHASIDSLDGLQYAGGSWLHRVRLSGGVVAGEDKIAGRRRDHLAVVDMSEVLRHFARLCALDVIGAWNPPKVVLDWLTTGDPALRSAARSAAYSAADSAAYSAADSAARSAAYSAADSAAYSAADSAADSAARKAQSERLSTMIAPYFS